MCLVLNITMYTIMTSVIASSKEVTYSAYSYTHIQQTVKTVSLSCKKKNEEMYVDVETHNITASLN